VAEPDALYSMGVIIVLMTPNLFNVTVVPSIHYL